MSECCNDPDIGRAEAVCIPCLLCYDAPAVRFAACHHAAVCASCVPRLAECGALLCPICRTALPAEPLYSPGPHFLEYLPPRDQARACTLADLVEGACGAAVASTGGAHEARRRK